MVKFFKKIGGFFCLALASVCFLAFADNQNTKTDHLEGIQQYQKHLPPEHKQRLADDITRYRNAESLWEALRENFSLEHYEDNPLVQEKIRWYMNNQDYLLRTTLRASPYLFYILTQVKQHHLPAELVLLPIIESGYNPFVTSYMGASGIWQMMPDTATGLGIKADRWYDGRRDILASTKAALNYLDYLRTFFDGNWLLVIAAYNTGQGNVMNAIKRNVREGKRANYWNLRLSQQTKDYVPSLLALATIVAHPNKYPVYLPPVRNAPYLAQVNVGTQISLKYAAHLAGLSLTKMKQLNPGLILSSMSKKGPYKLVLPIENLEQFVENFSHSPLNKKIDWIRYKIRVGDSLIALAKKHHTTPDAIRKLNKLADNRLHSGKTLLIPYHINEADLMLAHEEENRKAKIFAGINNAPKNKLANYALQPGDTVYMVRDKDSLESIAKNFKMTGKNILAINKIKRTQIKPGKQLIIPTHNMALFVNNKKSSKDALQNHNLGQTYLVRKGDTLAKIENKLNAENDTTALRIVDNTHDSEHEISIPPHLSG